MKLITFWNIVSGKEGRNARVMRRAWSLANRGERKFGGSSKEYLSISMKEAWNCEQK